MNFGLNIRPYEQYHLGSLYSICFWVYWWALQLMDVLPSSFCYFVKLVCGRVHNFYSWRSSLYACALCLGFVGFLQLMVLYASSDLQIYLLYFNDSSWLPLASYWLCALVSIALLLGFVDRLSCDSFIRSSFLFFKISKYRVFYVSCIPQLISTILFTKLLRCTVCLFLRIILW